jgi:hypothetical protein
MASVVDETVSRVKRAWWSPAIMSVMVAHLRRRGGRMQNDLIGLVEQGGEGAKDANAAVLEERQR